MSARLFSVFFAFLPCLFLLGPAAVVEGQEAKPAAQVKWRSYGKGRSEGKTSKKPLLLLFHYQFDPWTSGVGERIMRNPEIISILNEHMIPILVDKTRDRELIESMNIVTFPTIIIADYQGNICATLHGYVEPDELRRLILGAPETKSK